MNMFLSNFLLLLNLTYFAIAILKKKRVNNIIFSIIFILGVLLLSQINYPNNYLIGTLVMTFFYAFFIFILFEGVIYKKILTILLFVLTISLSEVLVANLMNYIFDLNANNINTALYTIALLVSNLFTFIILYFLTKIIRITALAKFTKFMWFSLVLPFTTLLLLYNFTDYFNTFENNLISLFVIFGLIISNMISLLAISKEFKRLELNNEIRIAKMKYEILNTQYNTNFYFLHDTIRELTRLSCLMNEKNYLDFQKGVLKLNRNLTRNFNIINTNSEILNSLLNYRINDINNYNIEIKTVIEHNDFSFILIEDQHLLFSTLLNISIESCIRTGLDNPRIIIKTKKLDHQIIVQSSFAFNNSIILDLSNLYTIISRYKCSIFEEYKNKDLEYYDIFIVFFINPKS